MIQADHVHVIQQRAKAVDPPAIPRSLERRPVVHGVAPELPLRAEIVGRHPGDDAWPALGIEHEELRMGPDVRRVRRDEERQIADQPHAPATGVSLEGFPLAVQQELDEARQLDRIRQLLPGPRQGRRSAPDQLRRPLEVGGIVVPLLQRTEQGVVVQPARVGVAELLVRRAGGPAGRPCGSGARPSPARAA